jgi:hypothetical protein
MTKGGIFDIRKVSDAVLSNAQLSLSNKLGYFLQKYVPVLHVRLVVLFTASAVAMFCERLHQPRGARKRFGADIWSNIFVTMASAASMELVTADGVDGLPITLTQLCLILVFIDTVLYYSGEHTDGQVQGVLRNNITYLFGVTVSTYVANEAGLVVQWVISACLLALSHSKMYWIREATARESLVFEGLGVAGVNTLRNLVLQSLPTTLRLISVIGLLCFSSPISRQGWTVGYQFGFLAYAAAVEVSNALVSAMPLYQAAVLTSMLATFTPVISLQTMFVMASTNLGSDLFLWVMHDTLATDPLPVLVSFMVFALVIVKTLFKPNDSQ